MNSEELFPGIRAMTPADLDRVLTIASQLPQAPHWPREVYLAALDPHHRPRRIALVAESSPGEIAAFCLASAVPPQSELETIAVARPHQRQGIARLLLQSLVVRLKEILVTEVMLEVRESNRSAQAFYASTGFVPFGRRPRYYADPNEDALLLKLPIG